MKFFLPLQRNSIDHTRKTRSEKPCRGCALGLVVLQKNRQERHGRAALFLLHLGGHCKQAGDEGDLPGDVSFAHTSDLSLANYVHDLIPLERSPCRFKGKEAQPWLDEPFDKAVVLLDQVFQVFDQALVRPARKGFQRL